MGHRTATLQPVWNRSCGWYIYMYSLTAETACCRSLTEPIAARFQLGPIHPAAVMQLLQQQAGTTSRRWLMTGYPAGALARYAPAVNRNSCTRDNEANINHPERVLAQALTERPRKGGHSDTGESRPRVRRRRQRRHDDASQRRPCGRAPVNPTPSPARCVREARPWRRHSLR